MKTPVAIGWLVLAACVAVAGCNGNEEEPAEPVEVGALNVTINGECQAVIEITELSVIRGQEVTFCNKWSQMATLTFSAAGFLPGGATSVTLAVGECVTHTVATDAALGSGVSWALNCQGYSGAMGGGPVKVEDIPPG